MPPVPLSALPGMHVPWGLYNYTVEPHHSLVFPLGQAKEPLEKLFVAAVHILPSALSLGSRIRRLFSRRRHRKISWFGGWFCASKGSSRATTVESVLRACDHSPALSCLQARCSRHVTISGDVHCAAPYGRHRLLPRQPLRGILQLCRRGARQVLSASKARPRHLTQTKSAASSAHCLGACPQAVSPGRPLFLQSSLRGKVCKAVLGGRPGFLLTRKPADSTSSGFLAACRKTHWQAAQALG